MSDKKKNIISKGPQKPNYQVWIIVTLLVVIFGVTYLNKSESMVEITQHRFTEMMLSNDVKQVLLIKNQGHVEITLKPEALQNAKYQAELENSSPFGNSGGPHYKMEIPSVEVFDRNFDKIEEQLPVERRVGYKITEKSDITQYIFNWGFLILILFGFWFLMKRMTGAGGPGGQIFNIGK